MRLVRAGVARSVAMGLLGHETESMFTRYALNDVPALQPAVEKLAALDAKADEMSGPTPNSDKSSDKMETRVPESFRTRVKNGARGEI